MKIIVTISGNTLDSPFDARFGRAASFCIVDSETRQWEIIDNPALSASGGAGVQAAQFASNKGAKAVISGAFGPNAYNTLKAAGIKMYLAPANQDNSGKEILDLFNEGKLVQAEQATHAGHHGGSH